MRFNPDLPSLIPLEQLDLQFGGSYEHEFEPKSYWRQLLDHCGIKEDGTRRDFPAEPESVNNGSSDNYLSNSDSTPQLTEYSSSPASFSSPSTPEVEEQVSLAAAK